MKERFAREQVAPGELRSAAHAALERPGWRFGHLTARALDEARLAVEVLLLDTGSGGGAILSAPLPPGQRSYPALTPQVPAAHWAERALGDLFGLNAEGHPRWCSVILNDLSPAALRAPLAPAACSWALNPPAGAEAREEFLRVRGAGVHEIPVGPIHAGIIEPGHFRFSCLGEVIANLEIRLGYQHRGVERGLAEVPWQRARFLAEAASSDTAVGNALAHAVGVEQLLEVAAPPRADALRTLALEVERLASHVGDLGGLCADIGYSAGASIFARLRGQVLGLGERLTGSRLQRAYVLPGGVARDLDDAQRRAFLDATGALRKDLHRHLPLVLEHSAVVERMSGAGRLSASLARDFGVVGPAARASGSGYDARSDFPHALYPAVAPEPAREEGGDVLARAAVRRTEIERSLTVIVRVADEIPESPIRAALAATLPPERVGVGVVEAWRGELIHWITTGPDGCIARYAIKDPSFNNWTGLAIAVRNNLVGDFPLCNKSFNLSYSGNDL